jgi:hypothetical protein
LKRLEGTPFNCVVAGEDLWTKGIRIVGVAGGTAEKAKAAGVELVEMGPRVRVVGGGGAMLVNGPPGWKMRLPEGGAIVFGAEQLKQLDSIWREVNGIIGRRNFGVRVFGAPGMLSNLKRPPEGKQAAVPARFEQVFVQRSAGGPAGFDNADAARAGGVEDMGEGGGGAGVGVVGDAERAALDALGRAASEIEFDGDGLAGDKAGCAAKRVEHGRDEGGEVVALRVAAADGDGGGGGGSDRWGDSQSAQ